MVRKALVVMIAGMIVFSACQKEEKTRIAENDVLQLANAYYTNGLYEAAVRQYLQYLKDYPLPTGRVANTYYTIGDIYFERIKDYEKALEYYLKVKYLFPESPLQKEVGKKIVACLERLERSQDAMRMMQSEAALDTSGLSRNRPGQVLAEIGERKITQGDLDFEISKLPPAVQEQFNDPQKKRELLQQLILQDLLYESARRQGLDKNKEVIEGVFQAKKALMANKLLQKELADKVKLEEEELELYYKANKERYAERDDKGRVIRQKSFDEVRQQVAQDLLMEKQQKAYQELAERLMKAEGVKIYERRIR
ncbi:hypothetical protein Calab_2468 [Caldithrix abyssi DSM 13497]|uniref:Foldase protein PrsA n=1 Tax=Caldithrix abyssi DSM 13497 TaxID=880073 RepID=H1XZ07_CALAY|nr:SurA N-terminal domain-containing protein [Caldithrix abyssi]APF18031.1 Foldase protein PrsA precursor [Caldithrix abyssi DSM 13497]EHO42078.1 hypothetical protein Calab_2468 [Caldithrix abyssi DSM 13497]